ncbi:MAG TPA: GNAT family N-acetyltransferase [Candidatus Limnocylindria bacterium]
MTGSLRIAQTEDLELAEREALAALCESAFDEPWTDAWERVGPGVHVFLAGEPGLLAHALIVDRRVYAGHEPDVALDVGYVEWVAARPDLQGEGHGTAVMREVGRIIRDEYALGALATSSNPFYERLGWETWRGPTFVRMADGDRVRSADQDGEVMVLRTPRTPVSLDLQGPIAVDWRPEEPW